MRECKLCGDREKTFAELVAHYSKSHRESIRELYLIRNLTRVELGEIVGLNINYVKSLLRELKLKKPRSLVVAGVWNALEDSERSTRSRNVAHSRRSNPSNSTEESRERFRRAAAKGGKIAGERHRERLERGLQEALSLLDGGRSLPYGDSRSEQLRHNSWYRTWREERGELNCDICRTETPGGRGRFPVDHSHSSLYIRGLLCFRCNIMLGWYENHEYSISAHLKRSLGDYARGGRELFLESLSQTESNSCSICSIEGPLGIYSIVVDHDHSTGKIRGLLCRGCNIRLGWIEKRLVSIVSYIEKANRREAAEND